MTRLTYLIGLSFFQANQMSEKLAHCIGSLDIFYLMIEYIKTDKLYAWSSTNRIDVSEMKNIVSQTIYLKAWILLSSTSENIHHLRCHSIKLLGATPR